MVYVCAKAPAMNPAAPGGASALHGSVPGQAHLHGLGFQAAGG